MPQDIHDLTWAADANIASGPRTGDPLKNRPLDIDQGLTPGNPIPVDWINYSLNQITAWLADAGRGAFGDGSDGDVTVSGGTTTLTADAHYENLTITSTGILQPAGYRVFVRGLLTIEAGGVIRRNGNPGVVPVDNITPGAAGAALAAGSLGGSFAGGAGAPGNGNGTAGSGGATGAGGSAGAGGDSNDIGNGANGGAVSLFGASGPTSLRTLAAATGRVITGAGTVLIPFGGGGGGGGGGGTIGSGGGGGSGGGVLAIWTYRLVNNGAIEANGGAGGGAFTGPDAAGNGGGGGGGGGLIWLVTRGRSGAGVVQALGGAGGAGHLAGDAGAPGLPGAVVELTA